MSKLKSIGKNMPWFNAGKEMPLMSVYKTQCLVQNKKRDKAKFLVEGKDPNPTQGKNENIGFLMKAPVFKLDSNRNCVELLLVD